MEGSGDVCSTLLLLLLFSVLLTLADWAFARQYQSQELLSGTIIMTGANMSLLMMTLKGTTLKLLKDEFISPVR